MSENLKLAYILKVKKDDGTFYYGVFKSKDMAELFYNNYVWNGHEAHLFKTIVIDEEWKW